jgi:NAD+ kinase
LAEVEPAVALEVVPAALAGTLTVEDRLMLTCTATSGEGAVAHDVVNDAFVGRGRVARAARLNVRVDGVTLRPFSADGVLIATPTGSTAYNRSAGGPVVYPALEAILVTPVVPHPNLVPPLVLPTDTVIEVAVTTDDEATLSLDGQTHLRLASGDGIQVRSSELRARFVRLGGREDTLRRLVSRLEAK